ncbi:hypothetical protein VHUM_04251 [Vanrija humicola]|uniref:Methyltransferase type 12 domain-containing protein n=1 Tax=Vanrija humicola TaxID=5417 RepID=A0A7D8UYR3_VANHU|nr:hypothetical protein VHUM_04251 [Vanrija humicola]
MSYPSVISQKGSAARNLEPVLGALAPLIRDDTRRVLELASYPYEHIRAYASQWPDVHFAGTVRDGAEAAGVGGEQLPANLAPPVLLDVAVDGDWARLRDQTADAYDGVIMLNLVHCMPDGAAEDVFRNLSPLTPAGRKLLAPGGWVAAYGAYLNDDGSFRSDADAKFDAEHIKGTHPSLGLRTPRSVSALAAKWGFDEVLRADMPKGNLWLVWRARPSTEAAAL